MANGLFATVLDLNYWLEVDVRTNNGTAYTVLAPLQALTPTPYAVMGRAHRIEFNFLRRTLF